MLRRLLRGRATATAALSSVLGLVVGCSCGTPPRPPLDGGPLPDAPREDAGPIDAPPSPIDAPGTDGGFDPASCRVQLPEDLLLVATDTTARDRIVSVAGGSTEWAITYSQAVDGIQNVFWALVPTTTDPTIAQAVTTGFAISETPSVVRSMDGWILSWMSNEPGNFEVFARGFSTDARALGAAARLTTNTVRDEGPALVRVGGEVVAAWLETTATTREVRTMRLGSSGASLAAATNVDVSPHVPTAPVLAPRLDGVALAFGSTDAVLVGLDATGARAVAPVVLSAEGNVAQSADLALDSTGGAIVFDVRVDIRPEVRGLLLGATGAALGPERVLTIAPDSGSGASITAFAGGYAMAYRALDASPPVVRVLFLTANLDEVGRLDVAMAAAGARTTIRASGDGRLLVGWADAAGTETAIRAARIRCD